MEKYILWAKKKELEALEQKNSTKNINERGYWAGKAQAFSMCWEFLLFGKCAPADEYNRANDEWSRKAKEE